MFSIHLGAFWVGSLIPLSSGSLCLRGHIEETMTEVSLIPPLTQTPLFSFTEGGNLCGPTLDAVIGVRLQFIVWVLATHLLCDLG